MPTSDPTAEACQLHALLMHAESYQRNRGGNPFVLVKINGEWYPVRAGFELTGEHENAVAIEHLGPSEADFHFIVQRNEQAGWTAASYGGFLTLDEAKSAMKDAGMYPVNASHRIVKVTEEVVFERNANTLSADEAAQIYAEHEAEILPIWEELIETVGEQASMRDAVQEWLNRQPKAHMTD